jgi:hypothetical protein
MLELKMLNSELGVDSNKCYEGLGFSHFYAILLLKITLRYVFYMIDKGDIPPIQHKISLRGLKSMRKVDGLSH